MTHKKSYLLEDTKLGPQDKIPESGFEGWKVISVENITKNDKFRKIVNKSWGKSSFQNRGLTNEEAEDDARQLDGLLSHISHYGLAA